VERRAERNEAVRALGAQLGADLSLEQQALEITRKVADIGHWQTMRAAPASVAPFTGLRIVACHCQARGSLSEFWLAKRLLGLAEFHLAVRPAKAEFM
jgi:hypothetical protein